MIGRTLSHYKILEKLGSGGMGDVYLAEDTDLERRVALKILPPELAESEERRARFQREAKVVAALNHPHIVTVHSVEQAEGVHFITMELVRPERSRHLDGHARRGREPLDGWGVTLRGRILSLVTSGPEGPTMSIVLWGRRECKMGL